jgi:hypothetical protein
MVPRRACRALALAGAFTCVLGIPPAVQAQSTQPASQPTQAAPEGDSGAKLPVSLDRIREGIQRDPKLKIDFLDPNVPLFRISVHENTIKLQDYWKVGPDTAVSRLVRPSHASRFHHDFLMMVTPKDYLATVPMQGNPVHPVGPPILDIAKGIKKILSNRERGQIRRQIQEELKAIEANQAAQQAQQASEPAKPETAQPASAQPEAAKPKTPPPSVPNDPR